MFSLALFSYAPFGDTVKPEAGVCPRGRSARPSWPDGPSRSARGHRVGCSPANAKAERTAYARPRLPPSRGGLAPREVERPAPTGGEGGTIPQEVAGEAYVLP